MAQHLPTLRAYFITFSTYGARLIGDPRGTVDRRANGYGEPMRPTMPRLAASRRRSMNSPPFRMSDPERVIVATAISALCCNRGWVLYAVNVRTNHVHLVIEPKGGKPEMMMQAFKAAATGALRKAGRVAFDQKVWSRHGSTTYLFEEQSVPSAVRYVVERQGSNLDGAWFLVPGFVFEDG
jgi:REP element-mobilizing transposase RayT